MTYYYEISGVNFSFDASWGYCLETGASDSAAYNFDVEEVTDAYEAVRYWLDWTDAEWDAYVVAQQPWNQVGGRTPDDFEDLPTWVYERCLDAIALQIDQKWCSRNAEDDLSEIMLDHYEPDTFSTWD